MNSNGLNYKTKLPFFLAMSCQNQGQQLRGTLDWKTGRHQEDLPKTGPTCLL